MQPYDYTIQRPTDAITAGIGRGVQLSQMFDQQKAAQLKQEALATQQQQARVMQADLAALAANKNASAQDYVEAMVKYPSLSEHLNRSWEVLDEDQKKNVTNQSLQVYSAISAGQTDVAEGLLEETVQAATNSGDDEAAKRAGIMLQLVRTNPDAAKTSAGLFLANTMGKEKFADVFTKLQSETRTAALAPIKKKQETQALKNLAGDFNLSTARTDKVLAETRKLNQEMRKAAIELEALEASGGIPQEKKFDQETKLRGEYVARTKNFTAVEDAFTKINESAADASGAGDIALITSFMKMLDPGSVVRETEFATAQDTGGLLAKLQSTAEKVQTGKILTSKQRTDFVRLANRYMDATKKQEKDIRRGLNKVVTNYKLNSENVFGVMGEEVEVVTTPTAEAAQVTTVQSTVAPIAGKSYMKYAGQQ